MSEVNFEQVVQFLKQLKIIFANALEVEDGKGKFVEDNWRREQGRWW